MTFFKLYHYPPAGSLAFAGAVGDTQGLPTGRAAVADAAGIPIEELVAGLKRAGKAKK
jgi:hypothetical protein